MPIKHVHELDFQCKANKATATALPTSPMTLPRAVIGDGDGDGAAAAITLTRFLKLQQQLPQERLPNGFDAAG